MPTAVTLIKQCTDRQRQTIRGRVVSLTLPPASTSPAVKATLRDETGTMIVTWLGRREVGGLNVGAELEITGVVSLKTGYPQMINPRYHVIPTESTQQKQRG